MLSFRNRVKHLSLGKSLNELKVCIPSFDEMVSLRCVSSSLQKNPKWRSFETSATGQLGTKHQTTTRWLCGVSQVRFLFCFSPIWNLEFCFIVTLSAIFGLSWLVSCKWVSTHEKPPPNPNTLVTFSHVPMGISTSDAVCRYGGSKPLRIVPV